MRAVSTISQKGMVDIPDNILRCLDLKEGDEIVWEFDVHNNNVYIERRKPQTISEFTRAEAQSKTHSQLLATLRSGPKTFNELHDLLKISPKTLSKELKTCREQGLIKHERRNKPYSLTQRGSELLRISEAQSVEGKDLVIETVWNGPFIGSILLRLPSYIGRQFVEELYTPRAMEDLNRIMLVSLIFWVNKHSQASPHVVFAAYGKDFNNDGIEDLMICETPRGYPNIRKALKQNKIGGPLWIYSLKAAEEKLSSENG